VLFSSRTGGKAMDWFHIAVQLDSKPWLVIFIYPNGIVRTIMDSHDFMDMVANEAERAY
jgi:hypothetical protein